MRKASVLASKVKTARPLPVPLDVVCSHEALAVADQVPVMVTITESVPLAELSNWVFDEKWGRLRHRDLLAEDHDMPGRGDTRGVLGKGKVNHAGGNAAEGQPALIAAGGEGPRQGWVVGNTGCIWSDPAAGPSRNERFDT